MDAWGKFRCEKCEHNIKSIELLSALKQKSSMFQKLYGQWSCVDFHKQMISDKIAGVINKENI